MKIVLDTNILFSAVFFDNKPQELIELVLSKQIDVFVTEEILNEYEETLKAGCKKVNSNLNEEIFNSFLSVAHLIERKTSLQLSRDKDDDKFLECAVDSNSDYIVTGDNDLLILKKYRNIKIVSINEFISVL